MDSTQYKRKQLDCEIDSHLSEPLNMICLSNNCPSKGIACSECLIKVHKSHKMWCTSFNSFVSKLKQFTSDYIDQEFSKGQIDDIFLDILNEITGLKKEFISKIDMLELELNKFYRSMQQSFEHKKPMVLIENLKQLETRNFSSRKEIDECIQRVLNNVEIKGPDLEEINLPSDPNNDKSMNFYKNSIANQRIDIKKFCVDVLSLLERVPNIKFEEYDPNRVTSMTKTKDPIEMNKSYILENSRHNQEGEDPESQQKLKEEESKLPTQHTHSDDFLKETLRRTNSKLLKIKPLDNYDDKSSAQINSLIFLRKSEYMVSGNNDGQVKIWNLQKIEPIKIVSVEAAVTALAHSSDEKLIFVGTKTGTITCFEISGSLPLYEIREHRGCVNSILHVAEANYLLSSGEDRCIYYWDPLTGDPKARIKDAHKAWIWSMIGIGVERTDGDYLIATSSADLTICLRKVKKKSTTVTFFLEGDFCISMEYIPSLKIILAGDVTGRIAVLDLVTNIVSHIFKGHYGMTTSIKGLRNPEYFLTCGEDKVLKLWSTSTFNVVDQVSAHLSKISSICPLNHCVVATNGWDKKIRFWNLEDFEI